MAKNDTAKADSSAESLSESAQPERRDPERRDDTENVHRLARSEPLPSERDEARAKLGQDDAQTPFTQAAGDIRKPFPLRPVLFALLPVALILGGYFYVTGGATMTTENAYVQADMVGVANDISGIVSKIEVNENQSVAVGDVLFRLDDKPFRLALDRANAQLGATRNDLLAAQANYRDMQAQIAQAETDIDYYTVAFRRQQQLATNNFTPQASFDSARRDLQMAQQKLASLKQQLAGLQATLNGAPAADVETYPRYREMLAARDEAARQLDHTIVRAPIAGIATKVPSLQPGQYLAASTASVAIVATDRVWVQAQPKETELTHVRPGQKAVVTVDTYPGVEWSGEVESISPASASSFSLLPAENTSGNWVKVVQRIPMRVGINNEPGKPQLRMGMSVELSIDTGRPRGWPEPIAHLFGLSGG